MESISEVENLCGRRPPQHKHHCYRVQLTFQITGVDEAHRSRLVQIYKLLQHPAKSLYIELVILSWQQCFAIGSLS